jgi:hypothetical protein
VSAAVFGSGSIGILQIQKSKMAHQIGIQNLLLKSWMFSLKGWRLLPVLKVLPGGLRRNIFNI